MTTLNLKRTFAAPRERVFQAWTDPAELRKWFHVGEDWSTPICEVDLRENGTYRIGMQPPDGETPSVVTGRFREVNVPEKLVYTWSWEGDEPHETLVTVIFRDLGDKTEIELTHERFPSATERDKHAEGWEGCLQQLNNLLSPKEAR